MDLSRNSSPGASARPGPAPTYTMVLWQGGGLRRVTQEAQEGPGGLRGCYVSQISRAGRDSHLSVLQSREGRHSALCLEPHSGTRWAELLQLP